MAADALLNRIYERLNRSYELLKGSRGLMAQADQLVARTALARARAFPFHPVSPSQGAPEAN